MESSPREAKTNEGGTTICGKEVQRYGVRKECGRPPGHDGECLTWSEWVASQVTDPDPGIPAGD